MRFTTVFLTWLIIASSVFRAMADDAKELADELKAAEQRQAEHIKQLETHIKGTIQSQEKIAKASVDTRIKKITKTESGKVIYPSKAAREKAVEEYRMRQGELETQLAEAKQYRYRWETLTMIRIKVGDVGGLPPLQVTQVIDKDNMLARYKDVTVWLVHPTKDIADGSTYRFDGAFKITGTRTYPTAIGGTNTCLVAKHIAKQAPAEQPAK